MPSQGLGNVLSALQIMQLLEGERAPAGFNVQDKAAYEDMLSQLMRLATVKETGFGGKGVNTGPFAQYIPETVSSIISTLEGIPERAAGDRASFNQLSQSFFAPTRTEQTGASAPVREFKEILAPQLPRPSDDEIAWRSRAANAGQTITNKYSQMLQDMQQAGYDIGQANVDTKSYMRGLMQLLYGRRGQ